MGQAAARKKAPKSKKIMGTVGPDVDPKSIPPILAEEFKGKANSKEALLAQIEEATSTIPFKYPVKIKIEHDSGVMDCYAVFWIWMRHVSKEMRQKWPDSYGMLDREGEVLHDVVCDLFLGKTPTRKVGRKLIEGRQKTLSSPKMSRGEMVDFLRRIEEWSTGTLGIPLPQPPSEYTKHR
jgi:hypothetical protein